MDFLNIDKHHVYVEPLLKLYYNFQASFKNTFGRNQPTVWKIGFLQITGKIKLEKWV